MTSNNKDIEAMDEYYKKHYLDMFMEMLKDEPVPLHYSWCSEQCTVKHHYHKLKGEPNLQITRNAMRQELRNKLKEKL